MTRLNILLYFLALACAMGVVTSQFEARKSFIALTQAQDEAKQMDVAYDQLLLEQTTWAEHSRIENIATQHLQMQVPVPKDVQVMVTHAPGGSQ